MNICIKCNSVNIKHESIVGRGLPPKGFINKGNKRISWSGVWDIWTCIDCGEVKRKLR